MKRSLLFLACAALLSACTVTFTPTDVNVSGRVRFGIQLSNVFTTFEPTRGRGAIYGLNESIAFRVRSAQSGYVTLTAINPTGEVYPIIRNVFVRAGETRVIPNSVDGVDFTLAPPRGLHRVRASFTPSATPGRVVYRGIVTEERWTQSIVTEVNPYEVRDIVETRFFLE